MNKTLILILAIVICAALNNASAAQMNGWMTPTAVADDDEMELKTEIDSVSYAFGLIQSQGLNDYLVNEMGIDTACMDEFYRGLNAGVNVGDDKKKMSYYAGIHIGCMISSQWVKGINSQLFGSDSTKTVSLKNIMAGFIAARKAEKPS